MKLAEAAGLSLKKYKKKLAKGLIKISEDGTPVVKKEKKDKTAEPVTPESSGKKRKLEDDVEKSEKKKKKRKN